MQKRIFPQVSLENQKHLNRYIQFINSRPNRKLKQEGFHTHHVYPRSVAIRNNLNDIDGDWNLIELTPREHFIAHLILWKCGLPEMASAFMLMSSKCYKYFKLSSRQYQALIKDLNEHKSDIFSEMVWINNGIENKRINILKELPDGFNYGRLKLNRKATKIINNGFEIKYIEKEESVPAGWNLGGLENKSNKSKVCYNNGKINKYFEEGEAPKSFVEGRISKIEKYIRITNGFVSKIHPVSDKIPDGWKRGVLHSTNKNKKFYNDGKNVVMCETKPEGFSEGLPKRINITNGFENTQIYAHEKIPDGWFRGQTKSKKFYITNGIENKQVCTEEDIPNGWYRGCTRNFTSKTTEKLSKANKGKIYISDGVSVLQWKKEEPIPEGCFILGNGSRIWINNGVKNQKHFANNKIPEGFVKGKLPYGKQNRKPNLTI